MQVQKYNRQQGVSLIGLIVVLVILAMIGVVGMKVVPTIVEFNSIKNAIATAKSTGTTPTEIRNSFDRQAGVAYIESITGKDLEITKNGNDIEVSFAYDKKIPLVGPASILIEYSGTTSKKRAADKAAGV